MTPPDPRGRHALAAPSDDRVTTPDQADPPGQAGEDGQLRPPADVGPLRRAGPVAGTRLLLLTLGMGGMLAASLFWARGQGGLAARILAGDTVLIVAVLLSF